ncbi:hypothetical protein GRI97_13630 [Altererythrobacter xixiisoli]|uniref:Uncharacterized protein n=1 Tax=Croceibacterium xixiisoli TaxID=1476466 RepID=A0A6I4TY57_9SPHN|nr:hypothetical protein [Croceibacterium xixiisoli]MXP00030.1 hypothetical protein [Croceibacterium xixiisoli]
MTDGQIVSLISLTACLILAVTSFRGRQLGFGTTAKMALGWVAIFLLVVAVVSAVNR